MNLNTTNLYIIYIIITEKNDLKKHNHLITYNFELYLYLHLYQYLHSKTHSNYDHEVFNKIIFETRQKEESKESQELYNIGPLLKCDFKKKLLLADILLHFIF